MAEDIAARAAEYTSRLSRAIAKAGSQGLVKYAQKLDSWANEVTGFGTTRDKTMAGRFDPVERLSDPELSNLYHGDDLAARMVDVIPQECFREGFEVDVQNADANTAIAEKMDALRVAQRFEEGKRWGLLYGGAAVLIGADDGRDARLPLIPERCKDINYLYTIDRRLLWPTTWYSAPGHPKLGQVETFMVTPSSLAAGGVRPIIVHESRLVLFGGATTGQLERARFAGWDYSILQRAYEVLRSFNMGWKGVELMLTDGSQAVYKMTGMAEAIASGEETLLKSRMQMVELFRSMMRAMVIDADSQESFERTSVNFANIPDVLDKLMLRLAAAARMPVTILFGQSPAGMNATGESDFRWFYDRLRADQTTVIAPQIRRVVDIWLRTKASPYAREKAEVININFPALWSLGPLEESQRRANLATADAAMVSAGVFLPEEVALSRSRPEGFGEEIVMTDQARQAREKVVKDDMGAILNPEPEPPVPETPPPADDPPPDDGEDSEDEDEDEDEDGEPTDAGLKLDADNFKEGDHPRDDEGKFTSGGGGGAASSGGGSSQSDKDSEAKKQAKLAARQKVQTENAAIGRSFEKDSVAQAKADLPGLHQQVDAARASNDHHEKAALAAFGGNREAREAADRHAHLEQRLRGSERLMAESNQPDRIISPRGTPREILEKDRRALADHEAVHGVPTPEQKSAVRAAFDSSGALSDARDLVRNAEKHIKDAGKREAALAKYESAKTSVKAQVALDRYVGLVEEAGHVKSDGWGRYSDHRLAKLNGQTE